MNLSNKLLISFSSNNFNTLNIFKLENQKKIKIRHVSLFFLFFLEKKCSNFFICMQGISIEN